MHSRSRGQRHHERRQNIAMVAEADRRQRLPTGLIAVTRCGFAVSLGPCQAGRRWLDGCTSWCRYWTATRRMMMRIRNMAALGVVAGLAASLAACATDGSRMAAGQGGASRVAAGEGGASRLAAGEGGASRLAAGEGGASRLAAGEGGASRLAAGEGGASRLAAGEGGASRLAAGEGGAARLAAGEGGSARLASGSRGTRQMASADARRRGGRAMIAQDSEADMLNARELSRMQGAK